MRILFVSSEMAPLAKSGGLGDVVGSLPKAIRKLGHDARVILPLYKRIKDNYGDQLEFIRWTMTKIGWRTMYCGLLKMDFDGVPVYFIDNEYYFGHDALYLDYSFDIERFSFFQRAVLEVLGTPMGFEPEILHLHDWQTGVIPVLLEAHYQAHGYLRNTHCLYTIHNLKFQGIHGRDKVQDLLELPDRYLSEAGIMKDGVPNYMKSGIMYSSRVTTVSPNYANEILTDYYGEGLNGLLAAQGWKIRGILNGIDTISYDPATDIQLVENYNSLTVESGKATCKKSLQQELGLEQRAEVPLLAVISRLTTQKGMDLLTRIIDELLEDDLQFVLLGTGDYAYEENFRNIANRHPDKMRSLIKFDEGLSRRIYAAADLFLMPSIFEPCGLSQLIAMRYGCLPVVRETGGLKDTVEAYNKYEKSGTGFSFANINAHELLFCTKNAINIYREHREDWRMLINNAMNLDCSWNKSAEVYCDLYSQIIEETTV